MLLPSSHDHTLALYETLLKVHYRSIPAQNYWYYYSHTKSHFNQFHFLTSGTAAPSGPVTVQIVFWVAASGSLQLEEGKQRERTSVVWLFPQPKSRDVAAPACATNQLTSVSCQHVAGSYHGIRIKRRLILYPQLGGYTMSQYQAWETQKQNSERASG